MSYKPRLALTAAVAASLVAASVARAQDHAATLDERCCCDPAPEPLDDDEDPSARAAIATGATFIAVGWATSAVYGALSASITNRYLGFVPLAGPLAIATHLDPRDNISGVGALIFSVWAQAVGAMILAIGATRTHRAPRLSLSRGSSSNGAFGSVSIHF